MHAETETTKVIAIDGPAGAGKSTVAREVAKRLGFIYLDTGAMYRAVTLKALREGINLEDEQALVNLAQRTKIEIMPSAGTALKVVLDSEEVTDLIRTSEVTNNVSFIARAAGLREIMVKLQRKFAETNNIVVEGRDIGTVVFPRAGKKFYLDAEFKERTRRRFRELKEKFKAGVKEDAVGKDLAERDAKDLSRKVAPLKKAEDAIYLDTTDLSIEEVVNEILNKING